MGRSPLKIHTNDPNSIRNLAVLKNETTLSLSVGKSDVLARNPNDSYSMGPDDSTLRAEVLEELCRKVEVDRSKLPTIDLERIETN